MNAITKVHDHYGRMHYVKTEALEGTRTYLTRYTSKGEEVEFPRSILHRSNICPHPIKTFITISVPGETWKTCGICNTLAKEFIASGHAEIITEVSNV